MVRSLIKQNKNGIRSVHLQGKYNDEGIDESQYIDLVERLQKKHKLSGQEIVTMAMDLLVERWHSEHGLQPPAKYDPAIMLRDMMALVKQVRDMQEKTLRVVQELESGELTVQRREELRHDLEETHRNGLTVLEGVADYAGGMFMVDDDEGE